MKKPMMIALAGLALSLTGAAVTAPLFAQTAPAQTRPHPGGRMKKMADYLGLTDAQKQQIKPILKSAAEQAKAIKADTTLTPAAKKDKMKALRQSTQAQIMPILTPDQQAKMAAMKHHGKKGGNA